MGLLPVSCCATARELRRALLLRRPRHEQLRHRRLSRQRLLHHRQARRGRARPGRRRRDPRKIISIKVDVQGQGAPRGSSTPATPRSKSTGRLGDHQGQGDDRPAAAERQPGLRLRLRRADLPPRQRLLEGHHPLDRLRRPADAEQPGHLPDRRPPRRVGRRRAEPATASWSASRSAGCRATTASRSSCRCAQEMFRKVAAPQRDWTRGQPPTSELVAFGDSSAVRLSVVLLDLLPAVEPPLDLLLEAALGRLVEPPARERRRQARPCRRPRPARRARTGSPCRSRAPSSAWSARCAGAAAPARRRRVCGVFGGVVVGARRRRCSSARSPGRSPPAPARCCLRACR